MKIKIVNILLSLLFAITFIVTTFCLTVLNKNFVIHYMNREKYYEEVYEDIVEEFDKTGLSYELTKDKVKEDIRKYVRSRYRNDYFHFSNQELRSDYNKYIKFNGFFGENDVCSMIYLLYLLDLVLIIITGVIFLKTKSYHNLNDILIGNFIISILLFGGLTLFLNCHNEIINIVLNAFEHYYLAIAIILFEIAIMSKLKPRLKS